METTWPVLHSNSLTPALWAPGIALATAAAPRAAGRSMAWAHGALILSRQDLQTWAVEAWVRGIFVTVVSHESRGARVASLCGNRPIFRSRWEAVEGADGGLRVAFSVDLEALLGQALAPGRFHVSASARGYRSQSAPLAIEGGSAEVGPFSAANPPRTPVDRLIQAYALASVGLHAHAVEEFAAALEVPALREDLDAAHLYNAACAAARAVLADGGRGAEQRLGRALAWLTDDLARRRDQLARQTVDAFDDEVERGAGDGVRAAALRDDTLRHFALARRGDRDLETLRSAPGFADLFRRAPPRA